MPISLSYDLAKANAKQQNHIRSMFERFGWERIGNSSYRFPGLRTGDTNSAEDWINCVVPALMCFRSYVEKSSLHMSKYTIDGFVSTGDATSQRHRKIIRAISGVLVDPEVKQFGKKKLEEWVDACEDAIPY